MQSNEEPEDDGQSGDVSGETSSQPKKSTRLRPAVALAALCAVAALLFWPRTEELPDFAAYGDVDAMKRAFFAHLAPAIEAENARVLDQRERLLAIVDEMEGGDAPGWLDRRWLQRLAEEYEVEWDDADPEPALALLQRRVDMVPPPLAMVQAATESGWGRSRFAVEGNNLFGQWCYEEGCGLVPDNRPAGAQHEVAAFDNVRAAVASYLRNLNTHTAYLPLRLLREQQREAGERPRSEALIDGLELYSERRGAYVEEIRAMLRANRPIIEEVVASA